MKRYPKISAEEMAQIEQDSWFDDPAAFVHTPSRFVHDISQDEMCDTQIIKKEDKTMDNTETLLETLTKAVVYKFAEDKTAPGVTVSNLKGRYYASIVRYDGAFGKGKHVVCNATEDTIPRALQSVATKFLGTLKQSPKNPLEELGELVKGSK